MRIADDVIAGEFDECLCAPMNTVKLRRLFTLFSQFLFSNPANYDQFEDGLGCLTYDLEDPEKSSLYVGLTHAFKPDEADQRPAVYVGVKNMMLQRLGIGDRAGQDITGAITEYQKKASIVIEIIHIHSDADVALMMAETSLSFFEGIRELMHDRFAGGAGLMSYGVNQLSEPAQEHRRPDTYFQADVQIGMEWQFTMQISRESHRLKKIAQYMNLT